MLKWRQTILRGVVLQATVTATLRPPSNRAMPSALVCIAGQESRVTAKALLRVKQHVLDPLQAELLLMAPRPLGTTTKRLHQCLNATFPMQDRHRWVLHSPIDISTATMIRRLDSIISPSWVNSKRFTSHADSNAPLDLFWIFHNNDACTSQVAGVEVRLGKKFEWLIFSRNDLFWMGDHPPLSLLDPGHIWHFDNQDHGGLNDRYWAVHNSLLSGVSNLLRRFANRKLAPLKTRFNGEMILRLLVEEAALPVGRILPLAARVCVGMSARRKRNTACYGQVRSLPEFLDAFAVAERLQGGWTYTRSRRAYGEPDQDGARFFSPVHCFTGNQTRHTCCQPGSKKVYDPCFLGKDMPPGLDPFSMPYSYLACCGITPLVSIVPPSQSKTFDSCWLVNIFPDGAMSSCIADGSFSGERGVRTSMLKLPVSSFVQAVNNLNVFLEREGFDSITLPRAYQSWIAKDQGDYALLRALVLEELRAYRRFFINHSSVARLVSSLRRPLT